MALTLAQALANWQTELSGRQANLTNPMFTSRGSENEEPRSTLDPNWQSAQRYAFSRYGRPNDDPNSEFSLTASEYTKPDQFMQQQGFYHLGPQSDWSKHPANWTGGTGNFFQDRYGPGNMVQNGKEDDWYYQVDNPGAGDYSSNPAGSLVSSGPRVGTGLGEILSSAAGFAGSITGNPAGKLALLLAGGFGSGLLGGGEALGGAAGGATTGILPESYWSALADAGGAVSDALPAGAGTVADAGGLVNQVGTVGTNVAPGVTTFPYNPALSGVGGVTGVALPAAAGGAAGSTLADLLTPSPTSLATTAAGQVGGAGDLADPTAGIGDTGALPAGSTTPGTMTAAQQSALSRIINGTATTDDWVRVLGTAGATGLSMFNSNQQANSLTDIANQQIALREPFRAKAVGYLNNANTFYGSTEGGAAMEAILQRLSPGGGVSDPYKQALGTGALYDRYQGALQGLGNLGLSGQTGIVGPQMAAANASGGMLTNLAGGLSDILNPKPQQMSLADMLKAFNLTVGGVAV